jgi:hypothetical protein
MKFGMDPHVKALKIVIFVKIGAVNAVFYLKVKVTFSRYRPKQTLGNPEG